MFFDKLIIILCIIFIIAINVDIIVENFILDDEPESKTLCRKTYIVKPGDTIWEIAMSRHGDLGIWEYIQRVKEENGLTDNIIYPGQRLVIFE